MRWVLAGLLFALAIGLAIASVAIRADNVRCRRSLEALVETIDDRRMEVGHLSVRELEHATPEQLAKALRLMLGRARQRAQQEAQALP